MAAMSLSLDSLGDDCKPRIAIFKIRMTAIKPCFHWQVALFHYDVTSKQSIVLTLRIMVARGDKTAAKQIKSQYNLVYDIVESESS